MISREVLTRGVWDADIDNHPDNVYEFESSGYKCKIRRNEFWVYCGYCTVPDSHPYYDSNQEVDLNVHGGITYQTIDTFGFDCMHGGDSSPGYIIPEVNFTYPSRPGHYWTFEEVKTEVENVARQLKDIDINKKMNELIISI